jgi:hypothetical protein
MEFLIGCRNFTTTQEVHIPKDFSTMGERANLTLVICDG